MSSNYETPDNRLQTADPGPQSPDGDSLWNNPRDWVRPIVAHTYVYISWFDDVGNTRNSKYNNASY